MGWWRRYLNWRRRHVGSLHLTADGFELRFGARSGAIRWSEISDVVAFKRDLLTTDLVCLLVRGESEALELQEEMRGYAAVEAALHDRLAIVPDWKLHVLFPAFAANAVTLFRDGRALAPGGEPLAS